jgi:hypothetical protein
MTAAHLIFAIATTSYIILAIQFEERDMVKFYGDSYRAYRRKIPMLIPLRLGKSDGKSMATDEKAESRSFSFEEGAAPHGSLRRNNSSD